MQAGTGETEWAFAVRKRPATVLVLVWKWNEGRREAAECGFLCACRLVERDRRARDACARQPVEVDGFLSGKEFWFAYF
jgi:hypothetical protein